MAIAIFFLLGFGLTASENVSIGTPGGVHENAPYRDRFRDHVAHAFLSVRDHRVRRQRDRSRRHERLRADRPRDLGHRTATSCSAAFVGGLIVAWLGYLAIPLGMFAGSIMPWVDPETIGPQILAYYLWPFLLFAIPNIFLMSALLFALATTLRSMMASYIGAVVLVIGYLITTSILGPKIEYRDDLRAVRAAWHRRACGTATRYWTQSEMNSRLVDLAGTLLFNRVFAIVLGLLFLGFTLWRFSMTERAPSKRRLRKLAKREARAAKIAAVAPVARWRQRRCSRRPAVALDAIHDSAAGRGSPGADQPRPDRPDAVRDRQHRRCSCGSASRSTGRPDHPTLPATITGLTVGFSDRSC